MALGFTRGADDEGTGSYFARGCLGYVAGSGLGGELSEFREGVEWSFFFFYIDFLDIEG